MEKTNLKKTLIHYGILSVIPLIIMIIGIAFLNSGDEFGYCLLNYYLIMPLTALVSGMVFVRKDIKPIWLHPIVFAAYMILIPLPVFHHTDVIFALASAIPSIVGVIIGILLKKLPAKKS